MNGYSPIDEEPVISQKRSTIFISALLLLGAILRFYRLTNQSYWFDELYIAFTMKGDFWAHLQNLWYRENHPPLYIIALKEWVSIFGLSEWTMRALSATLGTLSIYIVYLLARLLRSEPVALLTAALFCLSPLAIYYSQEVRYFALWIPLSALSFYLFFSWYYQGRRTCLAWALITVCALYTHIYSVFLLAIFFVLIVVEIQRQRTFVHSTWLRRPDFLSSITIILIGLLPLVYWAASRTGNAAGFIRDWSLAAVAYLPFAWTMGYSIGPDIAELHVMSAVDVFINYPFSVSLSLVTIATVFMTGLVVAWGDTRWRPLWITSGFCLFIMLSTPSISAIAFNIRSTLFLVPFFYILLGQGTWYLYRIGHGWPLFPIVMVALMLTSLKNYYESPKYYREDIRGVAELLRNRASLPIITTPMVSKNSLGFYDSGMQYRIVRFWSREAINDLKDYPSLWIIWNRPWIIPRVADYREYFNTHYRVLEQVDFPGIEVQRVERKVDVSLPASFRGEGSSSP